MENKTSINLAYDVYEPTNGSNPNLSPIVFLHSYISDRKTWQDIPLIIAEKTKRKVYAYDARNYGESDYTDEFTLDLNVNDLFYFMDVQNMPTAVLVGHSMGAIIAMNAALRKPERVQMVISEDQQAKPDLESDILFAGEFIKELGHSIARIPRKTDEKDVAKIVMEEMFYKYYKDAKKWTPKELLSKLYVPIKRTPDGRFMANCNTEALYQATRDPRKLQLQPVGVFRGPAVFLCGTESKKKVLNQESHIRQHFPNVEMIAFKGASHYLHSECKSDTINIILNVLNKYNIV